MRNTLLILGAAVLALTLAACSGSSGTPINTTGTGLDGQLVQGTGQKVTTAVGDGLGGVQVDLISFDNGHVSGSTTTTADGRFSFRQLPNGQFLLKIRFNSTADLDGDGALDFIQNFIPITLSEDVIAQLTAALNFDDTDADSSNDALKIDVRIREGASGPEQHFVRVHRHRLGETDVDENGDGSVDESFDDDDSDGLPDNQGSAHSGIWRGQIDAISDTTLTVGGQEFSITDATSFSVRGHGNAQAGDFAVGDWVMVKSLTNDDGTFTALEVRMKHSPGSGGGDDDEEDNETEIQGTIEALTDTSITVNGQTFTIGDDTLFLFEDKTEATFGDFAVGDFVEVKAVQDGDTWTALRIKMEDANDADDDDDNVDEREVSGTIEAITADSITVSGETFVINSDTQFSGGATGTIDDFLIGGNVEIEARLDGDQWVATSMSLEDSSDDDGGDDGDGDDGGGA